MNESIREEKNKAQKEHKDREGKKDKVFIYI